MINESEAKEKATCFGRLHVRNWDELEFRAKPCPTISLAGHYAFSYSPACLSDDTGQPVRVGGNWPILVDREKGSCRFVRGPNEYMELKRRTIG